MPLNDFDRQQAVAEIKATLAFYADQDSYERAAGASLLRIVTIDHGRAAQRAKKLFERLMEATK